MARGVNKVILVGNLGKDPETRYMPSGGAVTNATLATSESWNDKNTGQKVDRTEWHRLVFFNKLGEIAGEYLKKGSKIFIEGKLQTRKWQNQAGQDQWATEIIVTDLQMLDSRPQNPQQAPQQNNQHQQNQQRPQQQTAQQAQQDPVPGYDDFDDIPFN